MVMTSAQVAGQTAIYLTHTCTLIEPGAETGHDPEGEGLTGEPTAHTGIACWHYQPKGTGEVVEPGREVVAQARRIMVPAGTVVTESWQVAEVKDEADAVIVTGPLAITDILRYRGHLTIVCAGAITGDTAP